jgi:cell division protease FtsH
MICKWGMSKTLGPQAFSIESGGFIEGAGGRLPMGFNTARRIDQEVNELLSSCYEEAISILKGEQCFLKTLADVLLQVETLDGEEFDIIVKYSMKRKVAATQDPDQSGTPCTVKEICDLTKSMEEMEDVRVS